MRIANRPRHGPANSNWRGGRTVDARGYPRLLAKGHPSADGRGYIQEHVLVVELAMQREMPIGARVHHVNEIKSDNRNQNLVVCKQGYHMLLHARKRALAACGNPAWRPCKYCARYDAPENLRHHGVGGGWHVDCQRVYIRLWRQRKLQAGAA